MTSDAPDPPPPANTQPADEASTADYSLESMIEVLPALVSYVNARELVRYANPACDRAFGFDITGKQIRDIVGARYYESDQRARVEATMRGEQVQYETHLNLAPGSQALFEVQHFPDIDATGAVRGYLVHAVDISVRRAAEQELLLSHERFEDFASTTSDWFWEMDSDTNLSFFSTHRGPFATVAGPALLDDMLRMFKARGLLSKNSAARYAEDAGNFQPLTDVQLVREHDDGRGPSHFSLSGKPYKDESGAYVGFRGTISDITKRVEAENTMHAALAQAEQANVAKSRFLASASHDLRQPLQALRLLNGALREHIFDDDIASNILRDSEHALQVMDSLLASLLEMSKLESGVVFPKFQHFRISEMFERLRAEFARSAEEKGLRLKFAHSSAVVVTDLTMLESILRNLLSNAMRYTQEGTVLVGCRHTGGNLRIEVWDTGIGIPKDRHTQIFDAFYQIGDPERGTHRGLGLGLAIISGLGKLLGCPIGVRSEPDRGTVFWVTLPKGAAALAIRLNKGLSKERQSWDLTDTRVLILEDGIDALHALKTLLGTWNMNVLGAPSGAEAMTQLAAGDFQPDLIISDYRLADDTTGVDALATISPLLAPGIPTIFITGDSLENVRAGLGDTYPHLLQKPVAPAKLRVLIRNLLR